MLDYFREENKCYIEARIRISLGEGWLLPPPVGTCQGHLRIGHQFVEGVVFVAPREQQVAGALKTLDVLRVELEERNKLHHDVTNALSVFPKCNNNITSLMRCLP